MKKPNHFHLRRCLLAITMALACISPLSAIEINRYVAEGATGQGLTPEDPAGNLRAVLQLSSQVEKLTIYIAPGTYVLPLAQSVDERPVYRNVLIFGSWVDGKTDPDRRTLIKGDLRLDNSYVRDIEFEHQQFGNKVEGYIRGALDVRNANLRNIIATNIVAEASPGVERTFVNVHATTADFSGGSVLYLYDCSFCDSEFSGLMASGVKIIAYRCTFSGNYCGLEMQNCTGSVFNSCYFLKNKKAGAINIVELTDKISATFNRCIISMNVTTNKDYSAAITTHSPIVMNDCLIANNYSMAGESIQGKHQGAIELSRQQSRFYNCTFYKNHSVLYYSMTPADQNNIKNAQFVNCLFLQNTLSHISLYGQDPIMKSCAADFSTGIPELDAERGLISVTPETAGVEITDNEWVSVLEGSPLINAGELNILNDLGGISHLLLGGTDIGCQEYTSKWGFVEAGKPMTLAGKEYLPVSTEYKGTKYYGLAPQSQSDPSNTSLHEMLYLGDKPDDYKVLDDTNVLVYYYEDSKKVAIIQNFDGMNWQPDTWRTFTSTKPVAVKENDRWVLKEPSAASTTRKATTGARKTTGTRRR